MNMKGRVLALLMMLCMVIPMCLVQVSADAAAPATAERVTYQLFHDDLKELTYDTQARTKVANYTKRLESLYDSGAMNAIPVGNYTSGPSVNLYLNYSAKDTVGNFGFDGIKIQKGTIGDWVAIKFRSPGEGVYSISLEHFFLNSNNSARLAGYLLPGNTATNNIRSLLTSDNYIGFADILGNTALKSFNSLQLTTGCELQAGKDYLLVVQAEKDLSSPEKARVDMMFTGLTFGPGIEQGEGAFGPVAGEIVSEGPLKSASFYICTTGIHPQTGNDLVYLVFKANGMMVYDIDAKTMLDVETDINSHPRDTVFDSEGNLWVGGSGSRLTKYDPITGERTHYTFEYDLFGGVKSSVFGMVYGDDGIIYFTYKGYLGGMDPKTGEFFNLNLGGGPLNTDPTKKPDGDWTGYGGIIYKDGYLYFNNHGDANADLETTSEIIKFDIAQKKIVQSIDIYDAMQSGTTTYARGINYLNYANGILFGSFTGRSDNPVYIDISGDEMVRLDKVEGLETELLNQFTDELNGKYYMSGYVEAKESGKCLYEYDPATGKFTRMSEIYYAAGLLCEDAVVTVEWDEKLPGKTILAPTNNSATGMIDLYFYNPQTMETVIVSGISDGYGTSTRLTEITIDPTGRYIYMGGYGNNQLGIYDLQTGKTFTNPTLSHQIDGLLWYKDSLWIGNYDAGIINRYDLEYHESSMMIQLMKTVFQQKRMFEFTAGDNKVFHATVPETNRYGGALIWYDLDTDLIYATAGPNPEDVYYTKANQSFNVWRNALTHQIETFDEDGDGVYDYDFIIDDKGDNDPNNDIKEQRFYGVVYKRSLNCLQYVDGYIYGCTTKSNGQNAWADEGNAQLFVYDVSAMKLLATYDVAEAIDGLGEPGSGKIQFIDLVAPDPYEKGKFWGVVNDTLFSYSFDLQTNQFVNVKEELSFAKGRDYHGPGNTWTARDIIFDGDYLYVSFHNFGTWMINTENPSVNYHISNISANRMEQGQDGNIYYVSTFEGNNDCLKMWNIAQYTQPIVAASVQAVIEALPETVTMENEEQVLTAYKMYKDLAETTKERVDTTKLDAAVSALTVDLAAKADGLIDAIGEVKIQSEMAIRAARNYYDALPTAVQEKVTKLAVLEAAEEKLAELKLEPPTPDDPDDPDDPDVEPGPAPAPKNNTVLIVVIAAAVVLVAAGVVVFVVLRKKKSKTEE